MSWLRNLQGQLTDLANEVLSEATEEVADPESELQVANKKWSELDAQLTAERSKTSALETKVNNLQEQLYAAQVQLESDTEKYSDILKSRDSEIRKLKVELEQSKTKEWDDDDDDDDTAQRCADLQKEVAHWKSLVKQQTAEGSEQNADYRVKLDEFKRLKDLEISALMEQHSQMLAETREHYEEKLAALHVPSSSSTSNVDLLDAVLLEKEELMEEKKRLEELVKRKCSDDKPLLVDIIDGSESSECSPSMVILEKTLADANSKIDALEKELCDKAQLYEQINSQKEEMLNLQEQNDELTNAYNEITEEFERFKNDQRPADVDARDVNLSQRIEFLSASLVEYKERYEMCKCENAETVKQLEKLSEDFERLRELLAEAKQKNSENDATMAEEVEKLRTELTQSVVDRTRLREDIEKFKGAIESIDDDLSRLRETNSFLAQENIRLQEYFERNKEERKEQKEAEEIEKTEEAKDYIHAMKNLQEEQQNETLTLKTLLEEVKGQKEALEHKNKLLEERVKLFEEYQELQKKEENNGALHQSLTKEKLTILEELNDELKEKLKLSESENASKEDEVSSLNEQLSEALAAVSEMTDEYNKLKTQFDNLEKDLGLRQNSLDELTIQNNLLQIQFQESTESAKNFKNELHAKEVENCKLEVELGRLQAEYDQSLNIVSNPNVVSELYTARDELQEELKRVELMLLERESEILSLKSQLEENQQKSETSEQETVNSSTDLKNKISELQTTVDELSKFNEQLKQSLTDKHAESVDFYNKLVQSVQRVEQLEAEINSNQVANESSAQTLMREKEQKDKLSKELQRLKEHLVFVEETSTREAIEAEKRETDLRDMIRVLQSAHSEANVNASEATQNYESTVTDLTARLANSEQKLEEWRAKYIQEEHLRLETQEALSSLQSVVRELSVDHEKESANSMHKNLEMQSEVNALNSKLSSALSDVEKLQLDKQAMEETLEYVKATLTSKEHIIDDLEGQVEELRSPVKSSDSYRVDDATLRQLFMNFFTATPDTRPDIALLLASILEYSPEDVSKIKSAVKPGNNAGKVGDAGTSLAEQFVRFLENESESGRTAPHLPVDPR